MLDINVGDRIQREIVFGLPVGLRGTIYQVDADFFWVCWDNEPPHKHVPGFYARAVLENSNYLTLLGPTERLAELA